MVALFPFQQTKLFLRLRGVQSSSWTSKSEGLAFSSSKFNPLQLSLMSLLVLVKSGPSLYSVKFEYLWLILFGGWCGCRWHWHHL